MLIESIQPHHDAQMADIVRTVLASFGATGPGYACADPQVDYLSQFYQGDDRHYWVVVEQGKVLGGGGIGPLPGYESTCELQKMYMLPEGRGRGLGQALMDKCLEFARSRYQYCYLETLTQMDAAQKMYRRNQFKLLDKPLGATGHNRCDVWFLKDLRA
ncbi:GNAT family N-acetyltransferase [Celerinatantimonas sp. YJH-8]|uniref:GNAT family N-acetyltransferase n=1 Tax=Celerinatantimonas sp. YJH-8 TaxID=3228714 RepID=UPI0038C5AE81